MNRNVNRLRTLVLALSVATGVGCQLLPSNLQPDSRRDALCPYQSFARDSIPGLVGKADTMTVTLCGTATDVPILDGEFWWQCAACPRAAMPCAFSVEFRNAQSSRTFTSAKKFEGCGLATAGVDTELTLHGDGSLTWDNKP